MRLLAHLLYGQACAGIIHTDDVLVFLNYLAFSAFTVLRIFAVWDRDWKPLIIVIPLALVKPLIIIVSFMWNCPCDRIKTIFCQYEDTVYVAEQAGPPFGCLVTWVGITDEHLAKCVVHGL